jgi:prophage regulatory protein
MNQLPTSRRVLRRGPMLGKTGLSRTAQYLLEKNGDFPKHFLLTPRCAVWFEDEVDAWLEARSKATIKAAMAPDHTLRQAFSGRARQIAGGRATA